MNIFFFKQVYPECSSNYKASGISLLCTFAPGYIFLCVLASHQAISNQALCLYYTSHTIISDCFMASLQIYVVNIAAEQESN